jgi:excisionase family DNA binding protein
MTENDILTLEDVAEELQLKVATVRTYCVKGWIPHLRFGTLYRIRKDVLEKLKTGEIQCTEIASQIEKT